jgi:hydroxyacyl-ACP dehydratase HTD2-like protein with hotdog domain
VTLRHEVRQRGLPVLSEDQDIVFREAVALAEDWPVASESPDERRALKISEITLFRYSAVTFNAHRIHYDGAYCAEQGYPGLLVHGPLMATALAAMAAERGPVESFGFRATAPLYLGDVAWLCRAGNRYWVEGPRRRLCLTASVPAA